jgi:thioredoxin
MNRPISSKKIIALLAFICSVAVFFYVMNANSSLAADNATLNKQSKGMSVEEFQKKISQKDQLVLVYFNADWCVPCLKLKPIMSELVNDTKDYCEVLQINTEDNPQVADFYEINSLPMFVLYKNGKKLWENIGSLSKTQLQSKIDAFSK